MAFRPHSQAPHFRRPNEPLTRIEFDLLKVLTAHAGVTLPRIRISELMGRGEMRPNDRMIDVIIGRLRKKIEFDPANPDWVLTVHGEGYRFVDPASLD